MFIQIRDGRPEDDSSDVFRPPGNLFFDARSHVGIVVDGPRFPSNRSFQRVGGYRERTFQPNRCLPGKGETIGVLFSYL